MRILFASGQGAGHLGPLLPFARAAVRAGHEVLVVAPAAASALAQGLTFRPVAAADDRAARWAPVFTPGQAPGLVHVVQELFVGLDARAALPGMLAAVADFRPDLIMRETTEFASCVAAERFDVPLVRVGIHLSVETDASEQLLAVAAPALSELGLEDHARAGEGPVLTFVPPVLDDTPDVLRFRAPAPSPPAGAPLVYVSFGSEAPTSPHFPGLYRDTAEALAAIDLPVLMAVGRDPAALGTLPPSVTAERWVNQPDVLGRARAMVGHGGSGSTLQALAAGVPLALVPLFVDGHANADRVQGAGAGIRVDEPAQIARVVTHLLEHGEAATRIAAEIAQLPPVDAFYGSTRSSAI